MLYFYNESLFGVTMKFGLTLGSVLAVTIAGSASAENLNFNFLSPSFGGNPQNGAFLFGLAQIQLARLTANRLTRASEAVQELPQWAVIT
jgi:hypothetical protein